MNVSSAVQAPVDLQAPAGRGHLSDGDASAQSELAPTTWVVRAGTRDRRRPGRRRGHPGSLVGTTTVRGAYEVAEGDVGRAPTS